jgi:hypothetical protein
VSEQIAASDLRSSGRDDYQGGYRTLVGTLSDRGIPSIVAESGYLSTYNEPEIAVHVNGARNVMRHFGLLEGKPEFTRSHEPLMMTENWVAYASRGGVFHPQVKPGDRVQAGQVIALIRIFGEVEEAEDRAGADPASAPRGRCGNPVFRGWANPSWEDMTMDIEDGCVDAGRLPDRTSAAGHGAPRHRHAVRRRAPGARAPPPDAGPRRRPRGQYYATAWKRRSCRTSGGSGGVPPDRRQYFEDRVAHPGRPRPEPEHASGIHRRDRRTPRSSREVGPQGDDRDHQDVWRGVRGSNISTSCGTRHPAPDRGRRGDQRVRGGRGVDAADRGFQCC